MLQKILETFKEISSVPRCSFHEEKILAWLENWAKKHGFDYKIDNAKNIIIYVVWTSWRENETPIILQNHMDMVCVKDKDSNHNFETDPIEIIQEWNWIKANKTTLWADNGIGLAIALNMAFVENHPPLEILVTTQEEVGLIGALNLDASLLKWKKIINIDTEDLWEICVSSAWWVQLDIHWEYNQISWKYPQYKLVLGGMKWGHSGVEIDKNTYNAIHLFIKFLKDYKNIELVEFNWWIADNVIPKEFEAIIWLENEEEFRQKFQTYIDSLKSKYDLWNINFKLEEQEEKRPIVGNLGKIVNDILNIPIWIYSWSEKIENLVKTSNNLWILKIQDWKIFIVYMARSSSTDDVYQIIEKISNNFKDYKVENKWIYPGWEQDPDSEFVQDIKKAYDKFTDSHIVAYHAGLEVWALVEKLGEGAEWVSIWPTIKGAHTTGERCFLPSVEVVANVVKEYLESND